MDLIFRKAKKDDYSIISVLLGQIANLHHEGRPDIFKKDGHKYSKSDFRNMLKINSKPVFVSCDAITGEVLAYAFCAFIICPDDVLRFERKYLYVDDLCVNENRRGNGIGKQFLKFLEEYAREQKCYSLELNVWECNRNAIHFYEQNGFATQKRQLEMILHE